MTASDLSRALSQVSAPSDVSDAVARLLGATEFAALPESQVRGFHVRVEPSLVAVYAVGPRVLALHEQTADGRSFSLMVPLVRLRRTAMLEDAAGSRLTLELESDRSTLAPVEGAPGSLVSIPAGYEIVESDPVRRAALRGFQAAIASACAYA